MVSRGLGEILQAINELRVGQEQIMKSMGLHKTPEDALPAQIRIPLDSMESLQEFNSMVCDQTIQKNVVSSKNFI